MRFIQRGGKRFRVHIRADGDGQISVWFVDCTAEEFTRFAITTTRGDLRRRLQELLEVLG